jgi:hypothetical protein
MTVQHRRNQRVPVDLPPKVMSILESTSNNLNVPRTKLLRLLVIYGLSRIIHAAPDEQSTILQVLYSLESPVVINNLHIKGTTQ